MHEPMPQNIDQNRFESHLNKIDQIPISLGLEENEDWLAYSLANIIVLLQQQP
jgi:hypothetical protein